MAENARDTKMQEEFRNAESDRVLQQAGEGPEAQSTARGVPVQRLTGAEAEAELGHAPNQESNRNPSDPNYDPARKGQPGGAEAEALRVQHSGDAGEETDSGLPSGDQVRARVEGIAAANPD